VTHQPTVTHTHIWDGTRSLPTWLTPERYAWHDGQQLLIYTNDGDAWPLPGWLLVHWSDGMITVASPSVAERIFGADGLRGRAERAEAAIKRVRAIPRQPHSSQRASELGRAYTRGWESVISALDAALDGEEPS
jgi:hypothetical protein